MNFEFIDYSDVYYRIIAKKPMPPRRGGKFVQVVNEDLERSCLILSPAELSSFHANIIERFCMLNKIGGAYNQRKDYFEIGDPDWVVTGGGKWIIDDEERTARFFDKSGGYGSYDKRNAREALCTAKAIAGYLVIVE